MSASMIFYGSLFLSMTFAELDQHHPAMAVVAVLWLAVAWRYCRRPGWPRSGELSASSIFAILVIASLPDALGLV